MRLRDKVEIIAAKVVTDQYGETTTDWRTPVVVASAPAQVGYMSVAQLVAPGVNSFVEQLRAVMPVVPFDSSKNRIRWRGKVYAADGQAMIRRRNGRDHHMTLVLKALT
ncbi:hypothetical protein USB125703_02050 [Pseudoclavibacter triregionum]|nr:hypothetical protein USB125703_02050 [Pseudoclavibacter triregionum]